MLDQYKLLKLDAYTVECNSSSDKPKKQFLDSSSSPLDRLEKSIATTSDAHTFWVPKGAHSLKMKLPIEKTMLWQQ